MNRAWWYDAAFTGLWSFFCVDAILKGDEHKAMAWLALTVFYAFFTGMAYENQR